MPTVEVALVPFPFQPADKAHERRDACDRRNQKVIGASILCIERESPFGYLTHQQLVAGLQLVELGSESSLRHQFEEKLNLIFRWRRRDRIRTLHALSVLLHAQRGVLPGYKIKLPSGADAEHPQVRGKVDSLCYLGVEKFFVRSRHLTLSSKLSIKNPKAPRDLDQLPTERSYDQLELRYPSGNRRFCEGRHRRTCARIKSIHRDHQKAGEVLRTPRAAADHRSDGSHLFENVAYLANDEKRTAAFTALKKKIGTRAEQILKASQKQLEEITRMGGIVPELRAQRLRQIAELAHYIFKDNLAAEIKKPLSQAKKALKKFPCIGDPGAEKILLFTGTYPVLALESNGLRVLLRLGVAEEKKNYSASYRGVQQALVGQLPSKCDP